MKVKKISLIVALIIMLGIINGCRQEPKELSDVEDSPGVVDDSSSENEISDETKLVDHTNQTDIEDDIVEIEDINNIGYQHNNIANYGVAATQGDYIYYSTRKERNANLYRVNKDGSELEIVRSNCYADFINVVGNWVYYVNNYEDKQLCRTNVNDLNTEVLNEEMALFVYVDSFVYFVEIDTSGTSYLVKMDLDGGNKKYLEPSKYFTKSGNIIISRPGNSDTTKLDILDLSFNTKSTIDLGKGIVFGFYSYDGYIYCGLGDVYSGFELHRVSLDGTQIENINVPIDIRYFNILNDKIYTFDSINYKQSIVEISLDGLDKRTIQSFGNDWIGNLNIIDNEWLYFAEQISYDAYTEYENLYRMKLDGTELELVREILDY